MRFQSVLLVLLSVVCCLISVAKAGSVVDRVKAARFRPLRQRRTAGSGKRRRPKNIGPALTSTFAAGSPPLCSGSPERIEYHCIRHAERFRCRAQPTGRRILPDWLGDQRTKTGRQGAARSHCLRGIPRGDGCGQHRTVHHVDDLAGDSICFMIGSPGRAKPRGLFRHTPRRAGCAGHSQRTGR